MLILPGLHPAFLLKRGGGGEGGGGRDDKNTARFFQTCVDDMKKALRLAYQLPQWEEHAIWRRDAGGRPTALFPTLPGVWAFAQEARGYDLAVDVETTGESPLDCKLICVGMASANGTYICVPFLRQGGHPYWSPSEGAQAWEIVKLLLADSLTPKVFHNGAFDKLVVETYGATLNGWRHDTMQAQHVADAELPLGLGFCATRHLDVAYWKDDVKGAKRWLDLPDEVLRGYNGKDCLATLRLKPILEHEVRRLGLWNLYQEEIDVCHLMCRATRRGLLMDQQRREVFSNKLVAQRDDAVSRMRYVAQSQSFDPQKPEHLRFLLFDMLKLPVVMETKTGQPSTNKDAMVQLAILANNEAQRFALQALADFKAAAKKISTWTGEDTGLDDADGNPIFKGGLPILGDGRLHPQWKMTPNTGRLASSPNAQNWDVSIKKLFTAGAGRRYVGVDLSQAELRFIGYLANDQFLLRAYREGIDVHTVNMAWYFGVRYADGHKQANEQTVAFIEESKATHLRGKSYRDLPVLPKDREKPTRTLTKNGEFGSNYRAIAETLYSVLRAKRDPETNKVLFPDITLAQIEALLTRKIQLRKDLVRWWDSNQKKIEAQGYAKCPISGRVRHFRGGFKITECANWPVQTGIASHMNRSMLEIQSIYDRETGGDCLVVQQVHDALNADAHETYAKRAGQVMEEVLGRRFELPGHPDAHLPPDPAVVGNYLDEV